MSIVLNDEFPVVGAHFGYKKPMTKTLQMLLSYESRCIQFYFGYYQPSYNASNYARSTLTEKDCIDSAKIVYDNALHIYSHYPNAFNLAYSRDLIENGIIGLDHEIRQLDPLYGGTVVHMGAETKNTTTSEIGNVENFIDNLVFVAQLESVTKRKLNKDERKRGFNKYPLLLENSAADKKKFGSSLKEIGDILDYISEEVGDKHGIGICLDTQHMYGAGEYNLSKTKEIDRLFHDIEKYISIDRLSLFHLNDSAVPFNSKKDQHTSVGLGDGYIWSNGNDSLKLLMEKCKEYNIDCIMESPQFYPRDVETIRDFFL